MRDYQARARARDRREVTSIRASQRMEANRIISVLQDVGTENAAFIYLDRQPF